jgi:hypothetical protein
MRRVVFMLGWLVVLALAQASLNPTIGLLAVVVCALHIGLVIGRRGRPQTTRLGVGGVRWLARQLLGAPLRLAARLWRCRMGRARADTLGIQVYLADRARAGEIERRLRTALRQCAQTWAPHPLPVDRIAVHAGAPAAGRAQVYAEWLSPDHPEQCSSASLTVISLGLLDATGRPLDDQQLAGALASQVAALVTDRHHRQRVSETAAGNRASVGPKPATPASPPNTAARAGREQSADLVELPLGADQDLGALMDRLRQQARPLEPEPGPPPAAN